MRVVISGYRYYSPEIGRWLSRDPFGEYGGVNINVFIQNNPINTIDWIGLCDPVTASMIMQASSSSLVAGEALDTYSKTSEYKRANDNLALKLTEGFKNIGEGIKIAFWTSPGTLAIISLMSKAEDQEKEEENATDISNIKEEDDDPCSIEILRTIQAKSKMVDGRKTYKLSQAQIKPRDFRYDDDPASPGISFFETAFIKPGPHPFVLSLHVKYTGKKIVGTVADVIEIPGGQAQYDGLEPGHWGVLIAPNIISDYAQKYRKSVIRLNHAYIHPKGYDRRLDL